MNPIFFLRFSRAICMGVMMLVMLTVSARAETIIRDAEIEETIALYAEPILEAAGMAPSAVNFILVDSPQINAYVAGGPNIFIYTGLILETENPMELTAVIAHEMGHITGGHLIRMAQAMEDAQIKSIVGLILGGVVGVGAGNAEGGAAATTAAQSFLQRSLLSHTRVNESSADQAGISYQKQAGISLGGNVSFLEKLYEKEGTSSRFNEYTRTHPLTMDRIRAVESQHKRQEGAENDMHLYQDRHDRMKAKIFAYNYPKQVTYLYSSNSVVDRYARSMAAYRNSDLDVFLPLIDSLIKDEPENPYFEELKGQALFENGRIDEALPPLSRAVELKPDAPLIRTLYAHALIETGEKAQIQEAIDHLNVTLGQERPNAFRYKLLALAYGYLGNTSMAKLNLAQQSLIQRDHQRALDLAREIKGVFSAGSREELRRADIENFAQQGVEQQNKR